MRTLWLLLLLGSAIPVRAAEFTDSARFSRGTRNTLPAPSAR